MMTSRAGEFCRSASCCLIWASVPASGSPEVPSSVGSSEPNGAAAPWMLAMTAASESTASAVARAPPAARSCRPETARPEERPPDQHAEHDEHDQQRPAEQRLGYVVAEPVVDHPLQPGVDDAVAGTPVRDECVTEGRGETPVIGEVGGRPVGRQHCRGQDEGDDERCGENGELLHG